ncbi:type 1 fimbria D-mannose specific adhesin FimH [Phytobacter massiliensis]|uniref:type 1 fimbria D-mannose specific adhesin FimH n=1 Tax=Phytobacter massiliensis TaxID=1485952 RepID=UPI000D0908D4|nr:type 1 fimbria D-mannose specific adhesin FimH [Phytobacter massiliensis]
MTMKAAYLLVGAALMMGAFTAQATVCVNSTGTPTDVSYDLSGVFNSSNNQVGQIVTLAEKSGYVGVYAVCPVGTENGTTYRSYVTDLPVTTTIDRFKYVKLNDYLDGAMQITDDYAGAFYPPQNYVKMGASYAVPIQVPFEVRDSKLIFRLKVTRRFIDMVVIPRQVLFRVYVTSTPNDPLTSVVYTISYSGTVQVPQNCEVNAGSMVEFDFGDISASQFSKAGAGNRPEGVMPQSKTLGIKCTNIEAQAYLTLRLESEQSSGNMMVSSNPNVGFIVADKNLTPLAPNNVSSKIPFQLDGSASAQIPIITWPVSVTGLKPQKGYFVARGYLGVDFD